MSILQVQQRTASGLTNVGQFPQSIVGSMGSAIIESGSNANGNYVKFADGTLICYSKTTANYYTAETYSNRAKILNFTPPADFPNLAKFSGVLLNVSFPGIPVVNTNFSLTSSNNIRIIAQTLRDSDTVDDLAKTAVALTYNCISTWK